MEPQAATFKRNTKSCVKAPGIRAATWLDGHCPIDPETARMLAGAAAGWDRILTHQITGRVLAVDRYRPSEEQRRHLRVRDQHRRFPGCRLPYEPADAPF